MKNLGICSDIKANTEKMALKHCTAIAKRLEEMNLSKVTGRALR